MPACGSELAEGLGPRLRRRRLLSPSKKDSMPAGVKPTRIRTASEPGLVKACSTPWGTKTNEPVGRLVGLVSEPEPQVSLEHEPELVLVAVAVQRRPLARGDHVLERGQAPAGLPAARLERERAADRALDRLALSRPDPERLRLSDMAQSLQRASRGGRPLLGPKRPRRLARAKDHARASAPSFGSPMASSRSSRVRRTASWSAAPLSSGRGSRRSPPSRSAGARAGRRAPLRAGSCARGRRPPPGSPRPRCARSSSQ